MSRTEPILNQVVDAVLAALRQLRDEDTVNWLNVVPVVKGAVGDDILKLPRPGLHMIQPVETPEPNQLGGRYRSTAEITVICISEGTDPYDSGQKLRRIMADSMSAVLRDPRLGGVLDTGYIFATKAEGNVDASNAAGTAVGYVSFLASWEWPVDNP